jgi:hypothetical protein
MPSAVVNVAVTRLVLGLSIALGLVSPARAQSPTIPGYTGLIPNVPYLESEEQLEGALRAAYPQDYHRILEDYRRRAAPYFIEVPGGRLQVTLTPGGGQPKFVFFPNAKPSTGSGKRAP